MGCMENGIVCYAHQYSVLCTNETKQEPHMVDAISTRVIMREREKTSEWYQYSTEDKLYL